jgi:hypothetical protein
MNKYSNPDPFSSRRAKIIIASIILAMNIAFYTWGVGPDNWTGADAAYDINIVFGILMSLLLAVPFGAYIYFIIKDV